MYIRFKERKKKKTICTFLSFNRLILNQGQCLLFECSIKKENWPKNCYLSVLFDNFQAVTFCKPN